MKDRVDRVEPSMSSVAPASLHPAVAAEVQVARDSSRSQITKSRMRRQNHQVIARARTIHRGPTRASQPTSSGWARADAGKTPAGSAYFPASRRSAVAGRPPEPDPQTDHHRQPLQSRPTREQAFAVLGNTLATTIAAIAPKLPAIKTNMNR